jgi:23S rRNA pseudouridine1911/1915/1917 synthase
MPDRLDKLVAERFGLSRRAAQEAIRNGRIDLAGQTADEPGLLLDAAVPLTHHPSRPKKRRVASKLAVLYEDRHVIIVAKPAGLLTLPTQLRERDTLLSRVERYLSVRFGGRPYVGIVHRLDKDTTGALALARSPEALQAFQTLFRSHDVERQYLAVIEGIPKQARGTIDLPLVQPEGNLRRRIARPEEEGRPARTRYEVLETFGARAALVSCRLETGRTHQIRVHFSAMGHPVVGDRVYQPRRRHRKIIPFARQALHAQTLGFVHPFTAEHVRVEAPLPQDMHALISKLRQDRPAPRSLPLRGISPQHTADRRMKRPDQRDQRHRDDPGDQVER